MSGRPKRHCTRKSRGVTKKRPTRQRGGKLDLQKALAKMGIEFHGQDTSIWTQAPI